MPRRRWERRRKPKLWFVLELMDDERTDPSMYYSTEGLVRSSQALSRMNKNFCQRVRFCFRPGTWTLNSLIHLMCIIFHNQLRSFLFRTIKGIMSEPLRFYPLWCYDCLMLTRIPWTPRRRWLLWEVWCVAELLNATVVCCRAIGSCTSTGRR